MGKRTPANAKTANAAVEIEEGEEIEFVGGDQEAAILAEFGEGLDDTWDIKIYRQTGKRGPLPYLFSCTPDDFPIMDALRDKYGSGNYQARISKNGTLYKIVRYAIETLTGPPSLPGAPANELAGVVAQALERQNTMIEGLLARENAPGPQTQAEQMTAMLGMMKLFKEVMGPAAAPAPAAPALGVTDMIALIKLGSDLGGEGGGGNTGLLGFVEKMLASPIVEKMLEGLPAGAAGHVPALAAPAAPAPDTLAAQPQPAAPPGDPNAQQVQAAIMQHNLRYLVGKAAANADVGLYADWVIDNVSREILDLILAHPAPLQELEKFEPAVAQHVGWFNALLEEIANSLTAPEDSATP